MLSVVNIYEKDNVSTLRHFKSSRMKEQYVRDCSRYRKRNKNVVWMVKRVESIDLKHIQSTAGLKISALRACGNVHGQSSFARRLLTSAVMKPRK